VEKCVEVCHQLAVASGAVARWDEPVVSWSVKGHHVVVQTTKTTYECQTLVVTAGAWATQLLSDLGVPFTVMRQTMHWFPPSEPRLFRRDRFPVFLADVAGGPFYGLPMLGPEGVKVARHYGEPELASPDAVDWTATDADRQPVRDFLRNYLPKADGPHSRSQVCMYTLTPDRHFVIDQHPQYPQVVVAAGFSGHGFKFAPTVAAILADLIEQGTTRQDISLFRATRFR
jgi:sarcosine oxidase